MSPAPTMAALNAFWCSVGSSVFTPDSDAHPGCELCDAAGGEVLAQTGPLRIVLVDEPNYPGFCRVVWTEHVREMTDLAPSQRSAFMQAVCQTEELVRQVMAPYKINLASLGNQTPHLHWHVIPRYEDDAHFPTPVWATAVRVTPSPTLDERRARLPALRSAFQHYFANLQR